MLRVALTGGIAAGKSEVARELVKHGAFLIDADQLAREVVAAGTPGHAAIVERFGAEILGSDGEIERDRLAEIVFSDATARSALNAIVHPLVRAAAAARERAAPPGSVVVHDIPLLVETGQQGGFDVVVVVASSPDLQLRRLVEVRGLTPAAAAARIAAQAPLAEKLAVADIVIDNSGSLAYLREQVVARLATLSAQARARVE